MRKTVLAGLAVVLCLASAARAEDIDNKVGKLGRLSPQIGTYHYDAVLNDPAVAADLMRRLGPKGMAALKQRFDVQDPIAFDGTSLVLEGLMAHSGGSDEAVVSVRPSDGQVQVAMLIGGKRIVASVDQYVPQFPNGDVQKKMATWAKQTGAQVQFARAGGQ